MPGETTLGVRAESLSDFCARVFQTMGVPEEDARITAEVLVTADLRGVDSHGVARLRRYVNGLARDASRRRVFRRLMQVAESLNATVIAEGLEHPDDVGALQDLGVQYAQGFLLGRPVPLEAS